MYSVYRMSQHCIFLDGPYPVNFQKLYKGIIVVIDTIPVRALPNFAISQSAPRRQERVYGKDGKKE